MLVGAGGNAGNQASVRVIRGLALKTLPNKKSIRAFLIRELKMAFCLTFIITLVGFLRVFTFGDTSNSEILAITISLAIIVFSSICFGSLLPLLLDKMKLDPAHSSTSIQVIMDILGVVITAYVGSLILM